MLREVETMEMDTNMGTIHKIIVSNCLFVSKFGNKWKQIETIIVSQFFLIFQGFYGIETNIQLVPINIKNREVRGENTPQTACAYVYIRARGKFVSLFPMGGYHDGSETDKGFYGRKTMAGI